VDLNVFEPKSPCENDILRTLDDAVMTLHVAGATDAMFMHCAPMRKPFAGISLLTGLTQPV